MRQELYSAIEYTPAEGNPRYWNHLNFILISRFAVANTTVINYPKDLVKTNVTFCIDRLVTTS